MKAHYYRRRASILGAAALSFGAAGIEGVKPERSAGACAAGCSVQAAGYRSSFGNWEKRASVRVKPRRLLETGGDHAVFFPPELVPVLSHPLVAERGPGQRHRLLVHSLFGYLHFTTELEQIAVIPVTSMISRGREGLQLPTAMRRDAFNITTDEAWHAQFSYDLMEQVELATGVPRRTPAVPQFAIRLAEIYRQLDPDLRGVAKLAFGVVSETLISSILADLPSDQRLPRAVRELVADHAQDEGKHHAYFSSVLGFLWPALSRNQQRRLGPWLPHLIFAFLEPDHRATACALGEIGLTDGEISRVLRESLHEESVVRHIADAARSTIRYFGDAGALRDTETAEAFMRSGLIRQDANPGFAQ